MSVNPSARSSSSATYRGAKQILLEIGNRTVVVSGGASWANDWDKPSRPAAPADETVVRNRRRLCVMCMRTSLEILREGNCAPSLSLELALELVEEAPVGCVGDHFVGREFDHAGFAQPQRIEANRILGIIVTPFVVRDLLQGLQRIVVPRRKPAVDDLARGSRGIAQAKIGRLEDRAQHALGR